MEFDITPVIVFVVGAVFGLISTAVTILSQRAKSLRQRVPEDYQWLLDDLCETAVKAAQQVFGKVASAEENRDKLEYAKEYVKGRAAAYGITYDEAAIVANIEAHVYDLKQGQLDG